MKINVKGPSALTAFLIPFTFLPNFSGKGKNTPFIMLPIFHENFPLDCMKVDMHVRQSQVNALHSCDGENMTRSYELPLPKDCAGRCSTDGTRESLKIVQERQDMPETGKDLTFVSTFRLSHYHFEFPRTSSRFFSFPLTLPLTSH